MTRATIHPSVTVVFASCDWACRPTPAVPIGQDVLNFAPGSAGHGHDLSQPTSNRRRLQFLAFEEHQRGGNPETAKHDVTIKWICGVTSEHLQSVSVDLIASHIRKHDQCRRRPAAGDLDLQRLSIRSDVGCIWIVDRQPDESLLSNSQKGKR